MTQLLISISLYFYRQLNLQWLFFSFHGLSFFPLTSFTRGLPIFTRRFKEPIFAFVHPCFCVWGCSGRGCWGWNPVPSTCQARAPPLNYIPSRYSSFLLYLFHFIYSTPVFISSFLLFPLDSLATLSLILIFILLVFGLSTFLRL